MVVEVDFPGWEVVIGLETHAQITSASKLFSGSSTACTSSPNAHACAFDLAMPGMLPVLNIYCVEQAVRVGLALGSSVHRFSAFDRKHYFYPDLPAGYQISQFYYPIITGGSVLVHGKSVRVARAHLEQDAGKSVHDLLPDHSCVDFNRAGVALLEIVTEPDISSAVEAVEYMKKLQSILRYSGVCSGDMEDGALRCDANVSVRKRGDELGVRCEIKNLNSLTSLNKAIEYEVMQQIAALERGEKIIQCTKLFDVNAGVTKFLRKKENASDYCYFKDPDLPYVMLDDDFIDKVKGSLPELPDTKKERYCGELGLGDYDADVLIADKDVAAYFDEAMRSYEHVDAKILANLMMTELFGQLNKAGVGIGDSSVDPRRMGALARLVSSGVTSSKIAKQIFELMLQSDLYPEEIMKKHGLERIDDVESLGAVIDEVLASEQKSVAEYRSGREKVFGFFVGKVMKKTGGKANPELVNKILKEKLSRR